MVLRTVEQPSVERLRRLLMDIRDELDNEDPGSNLIATNLASAIFVMMIRLHLQQVPERPDVPRTDLVPCGRKIPTATAPGCGSRRASTAATILTTCPRLSR